MHECNRIMDRKAAKLTRTTRIFTIKQGMNVHFPTLVKCVTSLLAAGLGTTWAAEAPPHNESNSWVEPMKKVHARFHGDKGTFAHFGDSITVTMAFWAPLAGNPKDMSAEMTHAHRLVKDYQKAECWSRWKGPQFGNNGSMTIRWARENVDRWLESLNPEVVLIMFGSNDVGQMDVAEYETKTREVVARCLSNGTIVILSTMPPRSGFLDKSRAFSNAVRKIAKEQNLPLIDYFGEILKRRPDDWDGGTEGHSGEDGANKRAHEYRAECPSGLSVARHRMAIDDCRGGSGFAGNPE